MEIVHINTTNVTGQFRINIALHRMEASEQNKEAYKNMQIGNLPTYVSSMMINNHYVHFLTQKQPMTGAQHLHLN